MCHQFKGYSKTLGGLFTYVCILDIFKFLGSMININVAFLASTYHRLATTALY